MIGLDLLQATCAQVEKKNEQHTDDPKSVTFSRINFEGVA
jgi:hypothetical protein